MRDMTVEFSELGCKCCSGQWHVWEDGDWLASFTNEQDARDWADLQALRP